MPFTPAKIAAVVARETPCMAVLTAWRNCALAYRAKPVDPPNCPEIALTAVTAPVTSARMVCRIALRALAGIRLLVCIFPICRPTSCTFCVIAQMAAFVLILTALRIGAMLGLNTILLTCFWKFRASTCAPAMAFAKDLTSPWMRTFNGGSSLVGVDIVYSGGVMPSRANQTCLLSFGFLSSGSSNTKRWSLTLDLLPFTAASVWQMAAAYQSALSFCSRRIRK